MASLANNSVLEMGPLIGRSPDTRSNTNRSLISLSSAFKLGRADTPTAALPQDMIEELRATTFIPTFTKLRTECLKHTERKILAVQQSIFDGSLDEESKAEKLDEAVCLLRDLDAELTSELRRKQLEDPKWAESRGIAIMHFALGTASKHSGQYIMISPPRGKDSRSIVELYEENQNPEIFEQYKEQLLTFASEKKQPLLNMFFRRKKRTLELQPGSLREDKDTGTEFAVPRVILLWRIVFIIAIIILILFYGIGVIATNSTFSELFLKIFFWIALVWTLVPSCILAWLVRAVGGSNSDVLSVFLASIAIWLVVIQIGQTHLITQLGS